MQLATGGAGQGLAASPREQLLAGAPVYERRLEIAGVATVLLEGGQGPPVVLLHGQGGWAGIWTDLAAGLVSTHHVVAPDLPGLGASSALAPGATTARVLAWLAELIHKKCSVAPTLVGVSLGGSIAARFAASHGENLSSLVLVDAGGLTAPVRPKPDVLLSLVRQNARPSERNTVRLLRRLTFDLDRVEKRMGARWSPFVAYLAELASTPSVRRANRRLLRRLGLRAIPTEDLARIRVPTTLIWGRHDRVVGLSAAETASVRYSWPLLVVDRAGHLCALEQPQDVLKALRASMKGDSQ